MSKLRLFYSIYLFKFNILLKNIKYKIWNKRILLLWYKLWIRKNEFHSSLDIDIFAMSVMNKKEQAAYLLDISKRRQIAHDRDFAGN